MANNLNVSAPWYTFIRRVHAIFGEDEDIDIVYNQEDNELKLYVRDGVKADALTKLFDTEKIFGNVTTKITIIPANEQETIADIYRKAFSGNPVVKDIIVDQNPYAPNMTYVLFEDTPIQYFNDRLDHPAGVETILFEDAARDVFEGHCDGVYFGTECAGVTIWP